MLWFSPILCGLAKSQGLREDLRLGFCTIRPQQDLHFPGHASHLTNTNLNQFWRGSPAKTTANVFVMMEPYEDSMGIRYGIMIWIMFFYYDHLWDHPKTHHQMGKWTSRYAAVPTVSKYYGETTQHWIFFFGIQISGDFPKIACITLIPKFLFQIPSVCWRSAPVHPKVPGIYGAGDPWFPTWAWWEGTRPSSV